MAGNVISSTTLDDALSGMTAASSVTLGNSIASGNIISGVLHTGAIYQSSPAPSWSMNLTSGPGVLTNSTVLHASDVMLDGRSLASFMDKVSQRLCILTPDPEKLKKFQVLKDAYEHYLTLERLLNEEVGSGE